ncbi:MAG: TlpA disulfide reductase family protein [Lachnospiraceae bacterium]|nr:TlpA disulfide reductase family protein [Lachnospiraceae bacterium]
MIEDIVFTDTELTTIPASEVDAEVVSTKLKFTAENLEGEEVSFEDFDGTKLMIINFWEPWCGPCVEEMPDLDKLYKNYKDKGLAVVGVFADLDQLEEAREIIEEEGISYPILKDNGEFARFARDYVPSTVFVDGQGNLLTAEPLVGALKYEEWESIVSQVLS